MASKLSTYDIRYFYPLQSRLHVFKMLRINKPAVPNPLCKTSSFTLQYTQTWYNIMSITSHIHSILRSEQYKPSLNHEYCSSYLNSTLRYDSQSTPFWYAVVDPRRGAVCIIVKICGCTKSWVWYHLLSTLILGKLYIDYINLLSTCASFSMHGIHSPRIKSSLISLLI